MADVCVRRAVFLWLCGLFVTAAATCLLLGVPENLIPPAAAAAAAPVQPPAGGGGDLDGLPAYLLDGGSTSIEGVDEIGDKYISLADICSLGAVHSLVFFLAMIEVHLEYKKDDAIPPTIGPISPN